MSAPARGRDYWSRLTPERRAEICKNKSEAQLARQRSLTPEQLDEQARRLERAREARAEKMRSATEDERARWRRNMINGRARARAERAASAILDGARRVAEAAAPTTDAVECDVRPMVAVPQWAPPKPITAPVPALIVKGAGTSLMARAASILEAGLAAAQQAIAVQLETADGALRVAELAVAFVKADAKARGTFDALVALRKAALAWDEARGGGR